MSKTAHTIHWGGPPPRGGSKVTKAILTAASVGVGIIGFAAMLPGVHLLQIPLVTASHVIDRMKNGVEANDELKYRAEYYSPQIFKTLGMQVREGRKATKEEFKAAANINPELAKLYAAPLKKKDKENSSSLALNAGVGAVGLFLPGAKVAGEAVKATIDTSKVARSVMGASGAMGAISWVTSGATVDPQEYLEAIHKAVAEAKEKGTDVRKVVTPQMVFLLRVSQDPQFAEKIKHDFKKPFHKMNEAEQTQVMQAYPALANAATSEAYAVAKDILPVQELGAMKPNLNSTANAYAVGARNSSFADMVTARRAAQVQAPAGGIA